MRRRIEIGLVLALAFGIVGWACRGSLGVARWYLLGAAELLWTPSASGGATPEPAPQRIAHAGGSYRQLTYTNSLEAIEYHYQRGVRWFEIDFSRDAHRTWWAVHEWSDAKRRLKVPIDSRGRGLPELQVHGGPFRLANLDQILEWFAARGETHLITDTKDDNRVLLRRLGTATPELRRRIHPQIYRISEYPLARDGGFGAPIFTTYRSQYPWRIVTEFARRHPLLAVTVTRVEVPEACRSLRRDVPVLTHTVNDPVEAAHLAADGITGIYTDDLLP